MTSDTAPGAPLPPWTTTLGYAGLAPFAAGAFAMLAWTDEASRTLAADALTGYAAVILSFLGGVHWGLVLPGAPAHANRLLAIGVLPALAGWAALFLPFEKCVAVQVGCFGAFWLYEQRVLGPAVLPIAYLGLRRWLTLGVVALLGLAMMSRTLVPGTH